MAGTSLEKYLRSSAVFSEERIQSLGRDLVQLEKSAGMASVGNFLRSAALPLASIMVAATTQAGMAYYSAKKRMDAHQKALKGSRSALQGMQDFQKAPDLFHQRFSELALISPTVASNPGLASKVIQPRLKKGFDLDDVHRLSSIEYHSGASGRPDSPGAAARAQAMIGAGNALQYILPSLAARAVVSEPAPAAIKINEEGKRTTSNREFQKEHNDMLADIKAYAPGSPNLEGGFDDLASELQKAGLPIELVHGKMITARRMAQDKWNKIFEKYNNHSNPDLRESFRQNSQQFIKKEGSVMHEPVSDECLAKMLAETHLLCKEAGVMKTVQSYLSHSSKGVANYMKAMTIPLAIGVGIKAVQGYMDGRSKTQLREEADRIFEQVKKKSDTIRENMEIANQAFDALKSFAPALAAKPIIVKTFVENVVNGQGHLDPNTANMLAQTQQAVQSIDRQSGGFIAGLKEPMGFFQFKAPGNEDKKRG